MSGETIVLYRDNQELQSSDLNAMQVYGRDSLDHVVLDAINSDRAYSGFEISKTGSTTVKLTQGRLYSAGMVYAREDEVTLEFYNDRPISQKRYFAIVAWGTTVPDDTEPRNFVTDTDTGMAEPQQVSMREVRYCNISSNRGNESSDPQYPSVDATQTLIGYVLCDPTGVLSFEQSTSTQVDNLALVAQRLTVQEIWRSVMAGMVDTLRTDLANLARQLLLYTPLAEYQKLVDIVQILWDRAFKPGVFVFYGTDYFLDETQSDTDNTTLDGAPYSATVSEGLRFPGGGLGWTGKLELASPSEPLIQGYDTFLLPKPSGERVRFDCSFPDHDWIEDRILQYTHWSFNCRHLTPSRWRYRCGPHYMPCPDMQVWYHQANKDPSCRILSFVSESWEIGHWDEIRLHNEDSPYWPRHGWDRWKFYWRDWVHLPYWAAVYQDFPHSGNHFAQSFFNAQDGWLSSVTVFLMRAYYQPLTLVISGCDDQGCPDHENHTLRRLELNGAQLEACTSSYGIKVGDIEVIEYNTGWVPVGTHGNVAWKKYREILHIPIYVYATRISFNPVYLRAGQHFGLHLHSTSDHIFAISNRDTCYQVHQGHWWYSNGTRLVAWLNTHKSLRFKLHFLTWGRWYGQEGSPVGGGLRYEIDLQPLLLAGGIGSVDVLAEHIIPEACNVSYEVKVDNVWRAFASDPDNPVLDGGDTQLQFRMVMTGTTDLMPGVSFDNSEVSLTRAAANTMRHISTEVENATPTNTIKVKAKLQGFSEADHDCTCAVHYGAGAGTHHASDTMDADEVLSDGCVWRTWNFTVSAVSGFQIELSGANPGGGERFIVVRRDVYTT